MTPFDPVALVVMLTAFYSAVSVPALERARRERPEYFAAGELFGTHGEKMRLPDGRVFDLIFDVDGPGRRWQAIDVTNEAPSAPESFPLEPGPLVPIDIDDVLPPPLESGSVPLVSAHLFDVSRGAMVLDIAHGEIVSAGDDREVEGAYEDHVSPAGRALEFSIASHDRLSPGANEDNAYRLEERIWNTAGEYADPSSQIPPPI